MNQEYLDQIVNACVAMSMSASQRDRLALEGADPQRMLEAERLFQNCQLAFLHLEASEARASNNATKAFQIATLIAQAQAELKFLDAR